jgi:PmbA protein
LTAREKDDHQTGFAMDFRLRFAELEPEAVGREAAARAVRMLGAQPQKGLEAPVVFDPFVMVSLLGVLAPALTAEAVQKGRSLFAGRVGQRVASELVTIVDDGTLAGGVRSAPFDGEGVPSSRSVLIEKGYLRGYLHNTYTAAKDGVVSTGNGVRASFKGGPEVGPTNFYLEPGDKSPAEIIGEISSGLYVGEVLGMHTANPISGDFSVGATGFWIEQGKMSYPVRGLAIAGNIRELLDAVDAVGRDLRFFGGKGAPTVRVRKLAVSG